MAEPERKGPRRQLAGTEAIGAALRRGEPLRVVLLREGVRDAAVADVLLRARQAGAVVREVSGKVVARLSHNDPAADLLGMVGDSPDAGLDELLGRGGAVYLLVGVRYPGNAGFATRTAEVSGAAGIVIDSDFDRISRRDTLRFSMRADWFMPVLWERAEVVLERAAKLGRRIVGIETVGTHAPWDADLSGPLLFVIGGERPGLAPEIVERCDLVVRIPMEGFIKSYNIQTAVGSIASERLRQSFRKAEAEE